MKRRYNDGYYGVPVDEWEEKRIPDVVRDAQLTWFPHVAITGWFVVGQFVPNHGWGFWAGFVAGVWLVSSLFSLLTEVNENVRYVRHQQRAFRDAVRKTAAMFDTYQRPDQVPAHDILSALDREWYP
jgi:hypothetical protein